MEVILTMIHAINSPPPLSADTDLVPASTSPLACPTDVGRILRTFKIKKNVEVTGNGKDDF